MQARWQVSVWHVACASLKLEAGCQLVFVLRIPKQSVVRPSERPTDVTKAPILVS
jgi:hypothetical protein